MIKEISSGVFTNAKLRPKGVNLAKQAKLCLQHITENVDPEFNYVPYVGVTLGEKRPHFVHHRLDWTEVLPYSIYGIILARNLSGCDNGLDVQEYHRQLLLSAINKLDGLVYAPQSPWNKRYPMCLWEQSLALNCFLYWYMDTKDERVMDYAKKMIDTLYDMSYQSGKSRGFDKEILKNIGMGPITVGNLIDPLIKYSELTGNPKALHLGVGLSHFVIDPFNRFFDDQGDIMETAFYRSAVTVISGIIRAGVVANDNILVQKGKQIHDKLSGYTTAYGATPCTEPACSNMELVYSAANLINAGYEEYYDQIDRYVRNQTIESQFLDKSEWVLEKASEKRIIAEKYRWIMGDYSDDLETLPYDYYGEDVLDKCIGGFMWTNAKEHRFIPASLMLCCSGHAMRSIHKVAETIIEETLSGLKINYFYNFENKFAEIISYEPYIGKVTVIPKANCDRLYIRIPSYIKGKDIKAICDEEHLATHVEGNYLTIENVSEGKEYTFEYNLEKCKTTEKVYYLDSDSASFQSLPSFQFDMEVLWKGNTVIRLLAPSDNEKRIYKRGNYDTDQVEYEEISHFISEKNIVW
jgi:hypothetical protein